MSQVAIIIDELKKELRKQGLTYAQVADALTLSEASIKRLFAENNFSLTRLEQICQLANLELSDLFDLVQESERYISQLSVEQEKSLADDAKLLMLAYLLLNHWSFQDVRREYAISETEGIQMLAKLDRLKIIDLLPGNRIKMRVARNFTWRKNGPIQHFFEQHVQNSFFESSFAGPNELRLVHNGNISVASNQMMQQIMRRIAKEFEVIVDRDRRLDLEVRPANTMVLAIRSWELGMFAQYKRHANAED